MKIKRITLKNFRLLKDFSIDLQDKLSLIVGKNNVGKTSLLVALDKFINGGGDQKKRIRYNDFNLDFQQEIELLLEETMIAEDDYKERSISLRIICEFSDMDSLDNIGNKILTNLEDANNYFALGFDYVLTYDGYKRMRDDFAEQKAKYDEAHKAEKEKPPFDKRDYLEHRQERFFTMIRKSVHVEKKDMSLNEKRFVNISQLQGFRLDDIISFEFISARRSVDNRELDHTLSGQTSRLYEAQEMSEENEKARENFLSSLRDTDKVLSSIYKDMFDDVIGTVARLGGMKKEETIIKVISTLQHRELLKGNTTVVYEHGSRDLPENYNGLGYMNLISIIFEIKLAVEKMKRATKRRPADINLLFIEEPEAHTHPQMQYVFIKNIKALIDEGIKGKNGKVALQTVISTHSPHILADCDFDDIKYLRREQGQNAVVSKNISELKTLYDEDDHKYYRFLRQYLTVMNSELFFADKAIFIEGDTERILMPLMMRRVDEDNQPDNEKNEVNLLSQNISVLPIGAHSHIFEKFFQFIGLEKLLVVTDIDICEAEGYHRKCKYDSTKEQVTSNKALKHYFGNDKKIADYVGMSDDQKLLKWDETQCKLKPATDGNVMVSYETTEEGYQPRSFEDAFFQMNADFMANSSIDETALDVKALKQFKEDKDAYALAEGVGSKSALAAELILAETKESKWQVPTYIKNGLLWLRK